MLCSTQLRASAFGGQKICTAPLRGSCSLRAPVVVKAVQDLKGTVVSTAMAKSAVVAVERLSPHDKYFKRVRQTERYIVHNEQGDVEVGDFVRLEGCRPLSRHKRFKIAEVIREAAVNWGPLSTFIGGRLILETPMRSRPVACVTGTWSSKPVSEYILVKRRCGVEEDGAASRGGFLVICMPSAP